MIAAVIPPIPELKTFGNGDFHLLLTHLLDNADYRNHYKEQRGSGAYLILDNSAHEMGEGQGAHNLMLKAVQMNAQEVVVPDVLFNAEKTVERAVSAHETWFEGQHGGMLKLNPSFMYVPQGQTPDEWSECLNQLIGIHVHAAYHYEVRRHFVIGVSKDYEMWDGGIKHLIGEYLYPQIKYCQTRFGITPSVHLLGWGRDLWALAEVARAYLWIRSTDSAKPFVYALRHMQLEKGTVLPYPGRPQDYFKKRLTPKQRRIALQNTILFRSVAA